MPKQLVPFVILPIFLMNTGVHGQTADTSPGRTLWDHNGSVMYLTESGSTREFFYEKPRPGMLEAGVKTGSLLFHGEVNNGQYSGTARIFNPRCGQLPFQVKGDILDNGERIVLTGRAPRVDRNCKEYASHSDTLEFKLLKSTPDSLSQRTQKADEPKPEGRLAVGDTPGTSLAQVPAANDAPAPAKDVTGNIVRPQLDAPSQQQDAKRSVFGDDLDNYALAGAITVLIGALLFFFGSQLLRKLFWRRF
jgi:hypothetical protein